MEKILKNKSALIVIGALPIILIIVGLLFFSIIPKSDNINIDGDIEISTFDYYSKTSGEVEKVFFEMGESVKKGDVIASLKQDLVQNQIEQQKETLNMKKANLNKLINDSTNSTVTASRKMALNTIAINEDKLIIAQNNLDNGKKDLEIQKELFEADAISKSELEKSERVVAELEMILEMNKSELESSKNFLDTIIYPNNTDSINALEADIRLSLLQISQLEKSLDNYIVIAIEDGVILERNIEEGVFINIGQQVVQQSKEDEKHFVFYLPEEYMEFLKYGDQISIMSLNTSRKGEVFNAEIDYIDYKAVYTPKESESASNKNKRSIKIKARVLGETNLRAGERCRIQINTKI